MRIGIISDIHANLEALLVIQKHGIGQGVSHWVSLGDIVGYGPYPNECVKWVKENCIHSVLGNHDNVGISREESEHFNPYAKQAIEWTKAKLTSESVKYLEELPYIIRDHDAVYVHASPRSPADWSYVTSLDDALECFDFFKSSTCFIGHTHCPMAVVKSGPESFRLVDETSFTYTEKDKVLINVGSVGQPRDSDNKSSYVIYEPEHRKIEMYRVPYDIAKVQDVMRDFGLSEYLYTRLARGR